MDGTTLTLAFVMGLAGSLHCAGMCGPIIWIMPFQAMKSFKKWMAIAFYHFARISMYAILGLLVYSAKTIFKPEWQQLVSIGLGVTLVIIGASSFLANKYVTPPWSPFVKKHLGKFIGHPSLMQLSIAGLLNGMLPCGLVYMAMSMTTTSSSPVMAVLLMYAFGLGTLPMLIGLTVLKDKAFLNRFMYARKFVPALLFCFGSLFIIRGMNLGIPYLSHKVSIEHATIKSSCCHK